MIISASRRTDVPAFFGDWFIEQLENGWVDVSNPYNRRQISRISLLPEDVDAFVFWTKNPAPFDAALRVLDKKEYRYYFQFTLNNYSPYLEPEVPTLLERLAAFNRLSDRLGPQRVLWRYDPLVISNQTDFDFHRKTFERIADFLKGQTHLVTISLVEYYRKTNRRLGSLESKGIRFDRMVQKRPQTVKLIGDLNQIAMDRGMRMVACACEVDLKCVGVEAAVCVDAERIRQLWGLITSSKKDQGQRKRCCCVDSKDIGSPNTCGHGCLYCYANR